MLQIVTHARGVPPDLRIHESGVSKRVYQFNDSKGAYDVEEIARLSVSVSQFANLPQGDTHCSADPDYTYEACSITCFQKKVVEEVGCR
jgi:hypothetical protein